VHPRHGSSPDLSLSDFPEIEPVSEAVRLPDGCGPPGAYFHEKCGLILRPALALRGGNRPVLRPGYGNLHAIGEAVGRILNHAVCDG
jgi:hypothetical protein